MVKQWVVKSGRHKASYFRKEALENAGEGNVLGLVKNGELVVGEFLFVKRASREAGFVKVQHLEQQYGNRWLIKNADGAPSTLVRKHPQESDDAANTVGFALNGELVEGEYLFCLRKGEKRGGFVKVRHLKAKENKMPVEPPMEPAELAALAAALRAKPAQRWAVMDSSHDGAWMRRKPSSDRSQQNVICLVPNGATVIGDFIHLHLSATGEDGYMRFSDLEQEGPKSWRLKNGPREMLKNPDAKDVVCEIQRGESLSGEFVLVSYKNGKYEGFIKRSYLTALVQPQPAEAGK